MRREKASCTKQEASHEDHTESLCLSSHTSGATHISLSAHRCTGSHSFSDGPESLSSDSPWAGQGRSCPAPGSPEQAQGRQSRCPASHPHRPRSDSSQLLQWLLCCPPALLWIPASLQSHSARPHPADIVKGSLYLVMLSYAHAAHCTSSPSCCDLLS